MCNIKQYIIELLKLYYLKRNNYDKKEWVLTFAVSKNSKNWFSRTGLLHYMLS